MTRTAAAELGKVHFVGIGGAGMSGIARILLARGVPVSGSDARESATSAGAPRRSAPPSTSDTTRRTSAGVDTVVVSTAIRDANPEVVEAHRRGLRVLRRAAALAAVMAGRRGIAIAGTHGKTSTTSMLVTAAQACGADPAYAIGGDLAELRGQRRRRHRRRCSSPRPTRATARSCCSRRTRRWSPTSRPTTSTSTARPSRSRSSSSSSPGGSTRTASSSPAPTTPAPGAPPRAAAGAGLRTRSYGAGRRRPAADRAGRGRRRHALAARCSTARRCRPVRVPVPGRHMALNSAAALLTGLELGLPADCAGRRAGPVRRGAAPVRAARRGRRRDRVRRLRPPPDRGRRAAAGGPHGRRRRPGAGRVPAAPVQPDGGVRRGLRPRARAGRRGRRAGRVRGPRGPGARHHRRAGRRRRPAAGRPGAVRAGPGRRWPASWPAAPARATW